MEPFKTFLSPDLVRGMASHMGRHLPGFDQAGFVRRVLARLDDLELKARAQLIADELQRLLPADPAERARVIGAVLHPDETDHANLPPDDRGLSGWAILPLTMVIGQHGVPDFDRSMELMRQMTKRFSAEFGIRYFILADQARAIAILSGWLDDPNRHVRRLISEGSRPRLPWAMQLPALMRDPTPVLPLLERLRDDPEPYVRRSVANHVNDIAKDHPALIARLARDWMEGASTERQTLLRHACRSLIKKGDPAALAVFNHHPAEIAPVTPRLSVSRARMGDRIEISADIRSTAKSVQKLSVDYVMHFLKANGRTTPKVFKGVIVTLKAGGQRDVRLTHHLRDVTTRRHYPGTQAVSLRINGDDTNAVPFELEP